MISRVALSILVPIIAGCGAGSQQAVQNHKPAPPSIPLTVTVFSPAVIPSLPSDTRFAIDPVFTYQESAMALRWPGLPWPWVIGTSLDCTYGTAPYAVEFDVNGEEFSFYSTDQASSTRVWVDGQLQNQFPVPNPAVDNGQVVSTTVTVSPSGRHQVRIDASGWLAFGGVEGPVLSSTAKHLPTVAFMGDSYTEGAGANEGSPTGVGISYERKVGDDLGWYIQESGCGGTGYLNPGPAPRVPFSGRVQSDIIASHPSAVVIAGGINDNIYPPDQVYTAALALYREIQSGLPGTPLLVVGPWWPGDPIDAIIATDQAVQQAARDAGVPYISPIQEQWITNQNKAMYISSDGTHPNEAGAFYLASKLEPWLTENLHGLR